MEFENKFSPCVVSNKDGVLYFAMEVGQKKMETVAIAPVSFYFEYLFYLAMKKENDLYYVRKERCDEFIQGSHFSSIAVCLYIVRVHLNRFQMLSPITRFPSFKKLLAIESIKIMCWFVVVCQLRWNMDTTT